MNRWSIALVAVLATVLAVVLIRPAGSMSCTPTTAPDVAVVAPTAPLPDGPTGLDQRAMESREPKVGSAAEQLANPATPPDVKAAAAVTGEWNRVARLLRYDPEHKSEWVAIEAEANALSEKLAAFRADPTTASWPALVAEQKALIPRIRAAGPNDLMAEALDGIESKLAATP